MLSMSVQTAFADTTSSFLLSCKIRGGDARYKALILSLENGKVMNLTVDGYAVVAKGVQANDQAIGPSVFGVNVGAPLQGEDGVIKLEVSLRDYSDVMSWELRVSPATKEAAMISYFESSDGDGLEHVISSGLDCE